MKELLATLIAWGTPGLFFAAILDGAGMPIPGGVDVLIVFLASRLRDQVALLAITAVLGSLAGNMILFWIARRGGQIFLEKRAASARAKRFRRWFEAYGLLTVFVSALVPLPVMPMKIFVFSAGALGARPVRFATVFVSARIPRYLGLAYLGRAMGEDALGWLRSHVWHLAGFAAVLFFLLWLAVRYAEKRSPSRPPAPVG